MVAPHEDAPRPGYTRIKRQALAVVRDWNVGIARQQPGKPPSVVMVSLGPPDAEGVTSVLMFESKLEAAEFIGRIARATNEVWPT